MKKIVVQIGLAEANPLNNDEEGKIIEMTRMEVFDDMLTAKHPVEFIMKALAEKILYLLEEHNKK